MTKMTKAVMLLFAIGLVLMASVAWAGKDEKTHSVQAAFLSASHIDKGLNCSSCHGKKNVVDDNETVVNAKCVECHGPLAKMAEGTKEEINPHKSHLGNISCTVCHHGHSASWPYC